jgi:SIR2-like domain
MMSSGDLYLDDSDWELLLGRIADKKCTPIVGSGAVTGGPPEGVAADKWTFHYPVSSTLAQEWATRFQYPLDDATRIERVAQFVSVYTDKSWPRDTIARQLAEADPPELTPENEPHRVLAELGLPVYVSSNFDDYLERALLKEDKDVRVSICRWNKFIPEDAPAYDPDPAKGDAVGRYAIVAKDEDGKLTYRTADDSYNPTVANPLVYHIHGHMRWPASLVVTEDDYFEFLLNLAKDWPTLFLQRIRESFGSGSLLFLGYKLRDWDFRVLLHLLGNTLREGAHRHIAVQLSPMSGAQIADATKAASAARYLGKYFEEPKIKVYWGTCQEFVAELKRRRA